MLIDAEIIRRQEALDKLERVLVLLYYAEDSATNELLQVRATRLQRRLKDISRRYTAEIRQGISSGSLSRTQIRKLFANYSAYKPVPAGMDHARSEALDILINEILEIESIPAESRVREVEMNHLDMLPASAVLDMIDHARIAEDDCFYDLGAGLGQPTILVNLLCGARSVGVEYQPGYCEFARRRAELLGVRGVTFINADARQVNYADGTVFLLFSPFRGATLEHVLEKLKDEPISKSLRICSFGPCSEVLANVTWLVQVSPKTSGEFKLVVFERVE